MLKIKDILFLCFCFIALSAQGQVRVRAAIDSTELQIGEQTHLRFEVTQDKSAKVQFPPLYDSLMSGVEIIGSPLFDTVKLGDDKIQVNARVLITSFDTARYVIPPFKFVAGSDTFQSNSLSFDVIQPFEVDTVRWEVRDIKPVYNPKTNWLLIIGIAFAILLAGAAVAWLIFNLNKKRKIKQEEKAAAEIITPEQAAEIALRELERIKHEKLWQSGKNKEYYTDLTGVLRQYIACRYDIDAMEMTSDEILETLTCQAQIDTLPKSHLQQILHLADLVKFAKWKPASEEHDLSLKNSFAFVEETVPQAAQDGETSEINPNT